MLQRRARPLLIYTALLLSASWSVSVRAQEGRAVAALGRLEPVGGVLHVAGPSRPGSVIADLEVVEGEDVAEGQVLARLDTYPESQARVARLKAVLRDAESKLAREKTLRKTGATSQSTFDTATLGVEVARAELAAAEAALGLSEVRAPSDGRVLDIHARRGERIGPQGLLEIGFVEQMQAVAEVYETDIGLVRVGQSATVSSPALPEKLTGKVARIGNKVGKLDVLGTDPTAATDARVVEVDIELDDSAAAESLTNLQVEVRIDSGAS